MRRLPFFIGVSFLSLSLSGCRGWFNSPSASEERTQTVAHVPYAGLEVETANGAVEVSADPTRSDIKIVARITAAGSTAEEAKNRLLQVKVTANRRENDKALVVGAEFPEGRRDNDGCSFVITVPTANGVTLRTSNGSIKAEKMGGPVKAHSSNGSVTANRVQGPVDLETSNGSITYQAAAGKGSAFALKTSNGSITAIIPAGAEGTIDASTSNGGIDVRGTRAGQEVTGKRTSKTIRLAPSGPASTIHTSNGHITITLE